jgi:hypothetical protein
VRKRTNRNYYEKNNGYGYVVNVLKAEIGEDNTRFIIDNAVLRCNRLCGEYDNLPDKVKLHTHRMIFPRAALYIEMLEFIPCERAVELIERAVEIGVEPDAKRLNRLTKIKLFRPLFLRIFRLMLSSAFDDRSGFEMREIEANGKRLRIDVLKCPYCKYCELLGCGELTKTFCLSDDCIYSKLTGIEYRREGTLGRGFDRCDFDFAIRNEDINAR